MVRRCWIIRLGLVGLGLLLSWPPVPTLIAQAQSPPAESALATANSTLTFANGLLKSQRYDLAEAEYLRWIEANPNAPVADQTQAWFGLGTARLMQGNYAFAREAFTKVLELAPPDHPARPTSLYRLGEIAAFLNEDPQALELLSAFTTKHPDHPMSDAAWRWLAEVKLRLGDHRGAKDGFERVLAREQGDGRYAPAARVGLARAWAKLDNVETAVGLLRDQIERGGEWADRSRVELVRLLREAGRHDEALAVHAEFERDLDSSNPTTIDPKRQRWLAESRFEQAATLIQATRVEEAEAVLQPLVGSSDADLATRAALELGELLAQRNQLEPARTVWNQAAQRFPNSSRWVALMARVADAARRLNQLADAEAAYLSIVQTRPDDPFAPDAQLRAAELAFQRGDHLEARRRAAALAVTFPTSSWIPAARLVEARAALASGQAEEAVTILTTLIENAQTDPALARAARYQLARAALAHNDPETAFAIWRELGSTEGHPYVAASRYELGVNLYRLGRYDEAADALESYLKAVPETKIASQALAYLVMAHSRGGRFDQAAATLEQLARLHPNSNNLAVARVDLAERLYEAERYDQAEALFSPIADDQTSALRPQALSGRGWCRLKLDRPEEAARDFQTLVETYANDPATPSNALILARTLQAIDRPNDALSVVDRLIERHPDFDRLADARLLQARLNLKLDRPEQAIAAYRSFLTTYPGHPEAMSALLECGWLLLDWNRPAEVEPLIASAPPGWSQQPRGAELTLMLAEALIDQNRHDEARIQLKPLVENPSVRSQLDSTARHAVLHRWGQLQLQAGDVEGATQTLDLLLNDQPPPPPELARQARFRLGEARFRSDNPASCRTVFEALLEDLQSQPDDLNQPTNRLLWEVASLRLIQTDILEQRWEAALAAIERLEPSLTDPVRRAEATYAKGRALQGQARFDDARAAYQAVVANPNAGELAARAQLMLGETYFHQKQYEVALREYLKVEVLYDAPVWQALALYAVAQTYERLNQLDRARQTYDELLKRFPQSDRAVEARVRLETLNASGSKPTGGSE